MECKKLPMAQETVCDSNNVVMLPHPQGSNSAIASAQANKRRQSASDQGSRKKEKLAPASKVFVGTIIPEWENDLDWEEEWKEMLSNQGQDKLQAIIDRDEQPPCNEESTKRDSNLEPLDYKSFRFDTSLQTQLYPSAAPTA